MRLYEINFLVKPELSQEELNLVQEKVTSLIKEAEGILVTEGKSAKKIVAYPDTAYLATISFRLNPENIENLKKGVEAENQILRCMILTRKEPGMVKLAKKPSEFPRKIVEPKVGLKEIEKKLEEILGE